MAEKFTMSEPVVGDGGVAPEKKMEQEQKEELSHRVVVGDGGGAVLEEKKKTQEQEDEQSHRVVIGDGGGKKKQAEAPQQNSKRPQRAVDAAIPYKIRVMKEIMTFIGGVNFGISLSMTLRAILGNKGINGYVLLSMGFFIISTASAFYMDAIIRRITALVISVTAWILGWGFLAAVLTLGELGMLFIASIIVILPLILPTFMNLNRP